ncbi:MAG: heme exporter protein CcmB [Halobacteriales archaeon]|nr:heme exporter protein CcmB [Halobacteriales archaeon]
MSALRVAAKDLTIELRARELLDAALLGALAVAVVAGLGLAAAAPRAEGAAVALWVGAVLSTSLPLARSFTGEADRGTLDVLLALPVDRGAILLGKVLSNAVLALAAELVLLVAYLGLFGSLAPLDVPGVLLLLLLGTLGLSAAGSTLAAIAAQTRSREALLPVLLFPMLLPVLLSAVPGTVHALRGDGFAAFQGEAMVLAGYDLVLLVAGWLLFDTIVEG